MGMRSAQIWGRRQVIVTILGVMLTASCATQPTGMVQPSPAATQRTRPPAPTATSLNTPTPPPVNVWRGIVPGQTNRRQVLRTLGEPNTIQTYQDCESLNYYPQEWSSFQFDSYYVVLCNDIVQLITAYDRGQEMILTLSDAQKELGEYDTVISYDHPGDDIYVFASRGLAIGARWNFRGFTEYFAPMSTTEYLASWGKYYPEDRPFPRSFPGHPIEAGIKPGESTGANVHALYHDPDFIGKRPEWGVPPDHDRAWDDLEIWCYRVPQTVKWQNYVDSQALVSFVLDDEDTVQLIHLWGVIGPRWTISETMQTLGAPEWSYERQPPWSEFPENQRAYFWPDKGYACVSMGDWEARPSDKLQSEWFYPPMSWDRYRNSWGAGPRVGCSWNPFYFQNAQLTRWKGFTNIWE